VGVLREFAVLLDVARLHLAVAEDPVVLKPSQCRCRASMTRCLIVSAARRHSRWRVPCTARRDLDMDVDTIHERPDTRDGSGFHSRGAGALVARVAEKPAGQGFMAATRSNCAG